MLYAGYGRRRQFRIWGDFTNRGKCHCKSSFVDFGPRQALQCPPKTPCNTRQIWLS
ncbi:hypothetical protein HYPBUDRAFT_151965 [Hyphopichia burtonii NRRL Y-1933]|uniref:Uncharacterized protein n=1 Tax=Hyphopichia burtonii NRRL Y-1933 TaxID=984485 RepID=A0A1E4RMP8_9ASCO|nr:hypothetical protein HYPBUDRAFT_151965 [Hyphopichia burtonii NRRL Y-1933]ODV68533.1 hypothetical protein HYPBUDRAFT_151965 [Hyphopichia burtonii NRRL Y-1933]